MEVGEWQGLLPMAIFVVVMMFLFWWIIIRPTSQRQREHRQLVATVQKDDKIVTVGGIYGTITHVGEDDIGVRVADGVILTFDRRAIRRHQ